MSWNKEGWEDLRKLAEESSGRLRESRRRLVDQAEELLRKLDELLRKLHPEER